MHIIKEKQYKEAPLNKEEKDLIKLRIELVKEPSNVKKADIGLLIQAVKKELVKSGRYKYYAGDRVSAESILY